MNNVINIYRGTNEVWTDRRIKNAFRDAIMSQSDASIDEVADSFLDWMTDEESIHYKVVKEAIADVQKEFSPNSKAANK